MTEKLPPLVGLYSPAPASGKTTLAQHLYPYGWKTLKFAGPLKGMLVELLVRAGVDDKTILRMLDGDLKETPHPALAGRTPRYALQTLGTEWGRDMMAPDFWVRQFLIAQDTARHIGMAVVCDDMRFPNEAQAIKDAGGLLVKIIRPDAETHSTHASEGGLDGWAFDLVLYNTKSTAKEWGALAADDISEFTGYIWRENTR